MYRDRSEALTRREMDIIVYLFRHRDRIVSKGELLTEVWHYKDPNVETRTVDIHMLKLRKKIASLADGSNSDPDGSRRRIPPGAGALKRLRLYMIIFCVLVSLPLAFRGLADLRRARIGKRRGRYVSLRNGCWTRLKPNWPTLVHGGRKTGPWTNTATPWCRRAAPPRHHLARLPVESFILGYFQNDPDGSFQTPLVNEGAGGVCRS